MKKVLNYAIAVFILAVIGSVYAASFIGLIGISLILGVFLSILFLAKKTDIKRTTLVFFLFTALAFFSGFATNSAEACHIINGNRYEGTVVRTVHFFWRPVGEPKKVFRL